MRAGTTTSMGRPCMISLACEFGMHCSTVPRDRVAVVDAVCMVRPPYCVPRRPNRKLKMFWAVTACAVVPTVISGVG